MEEEQDHIKLQQFTDEQLYLPEFMRDIHNIINLFKAVEDAIVINRKESNNPIFAQGNINWSDAMVYTVDIFLVFMAHHGYKLQKIDETLPFFEIIQTMEEWKSLNIEKYRKFL
jgi:hypothetical protein